MAGSSGPPTSRRGGWLNTGRPTLGDITNPRIAVQARICLDWTCEDPSEEALGSIVLDRTYFERTAPLRPGDHTNSAYSNHFTSLHFASLRFACSPGGTNEGPRSRIDSIRVILYLFLEVRF